MPIDPEFIPAKKFTIEDLRSLSSKVKGDLGTIDEEVHVIFRYLDALDDMIRYFEETGLMNPGIMKNDRGAKIDAILKMQKSQAEKEALSRFIELHLPKGSKFDLKSGMLMFPDLAKYAFLLMFGTACIIAALRLGRPADDIARDKYEEEYRQWREQYYDRPDHLKSYDQNGRVEMVGEQEGTKIIPVPKSPIRVPDIKDH